MNNITISFIRAFLFIGAIAFGIQATVMPKAKVVNIKTSAVCESCKKRIEKGLSQQDGVMEAILNLNSKQVKIKYDPAKTSDVQLRQAIANMGYNADEVKANAEAYHKLPACCQKPGVCAH
ncbi:MAG: heavy-metal-associated domain-containing protein [Bacteroidetes bacterium]|nr:heavy-metal-associated domain-containing protein [Bacteroidota bacterium]